MASSGFVTRGRGRSLEGCLLIAQLRPGICPMETSVIVYGQDFDLEEGPEPWQRQSGTA